MLKLASSALLAYLIAAPLTSRIALDLRGTHWHDIGTYLWLAGVWGYLGFFVFLLAAYRASSPGDEWRKT